MATDINNSSLNLSSEERRVYGQFFQQADPESLGVVTGDIAVKFFERTKLDPVKLGEIWQIADKENRGLLTPAGFSVALRLIGHCQAGRTPSLELATRPGPLPKFDGAGAPSQGQRPSTPLQALNPQLSGPIRVPPLTPEKVNEYQILFEKAGARNGLLGGDAARQMFEKAKLPTEVLGRIWNLADSEQRGALNLTEFIIAMHLLTSMRNGSLRALPQNLPSGLYEAANRRPPPVTTSGIARQFTGDTQRTQSPIPRPFGTPELAPQSTGSDWLVTTQDKVKFDQIFATIDRVGSGTINGDQAVQFFSSSGLSEDSLASIWDLADIRSEGHLNRDEFAVAMYLIRQQRGKKDDRDSLPTSLPPGLIPPTMRQRPIPPSQPTAPVFDNAAFASQQPKSASDDLFGLDALATDNTGPQQPPAPTAASQLPISPSASQSTTFKPFMPTSTFGQGLATQSTGGSFQSAPSQASARAIPQPQATTDDLLGDNDPEISNRLTEETTELANMSNQIGNLRTQMHEVQGNKSAAGSNLSSTNTQKRELEARLGLLRSQYEQEVREVKTLEERLNASRNDTRKLQQEAAMIEGTQLDLQTQHQQIAAVLNGDQRENLSLKERIRQLNTEVAELRPQLEKMRSDARQQRGLVAINKKQLATSEAEKEKLLGEMADIEKEKAQIVAEQAQITSRSESIQREQAEAVTRLESIRAEHGQATHRMHFARREQAAAAAHLESIKREHAEAIAQLESIKRGQADYAGRLETTYREHAETAARFESLQREQAEATARLESTQREHAEAAANVESMRHEPRSSIASPSLSTAGPNTNPFFRRSPQPALERALSPSIFTEEHAPSQSVNDFDSFFGPQSHPSASAGATFPSESGHSEGGFENIATPSVSSLSTSVGGLPRSAEPPAPPQSRQITSSFLPFRSNLARSESFSSSVKANPPASAAGLSNAATPTQSPTLSLNGDGEHVSEQTQDRATALRAEDATVVTSNHKQPLDQVSKALETKSRNERPASRDNQPQILGDSVPGAFPGTPMPSTPTGGSTASERSAVDAPIAGHSTLETSDPFATRNEQSTSIGQAATTFEDSSISQSAQSHQADFTSAFESMPTTAANAGPSLLTTEFPPIKELDASDDSDSESDRGFDDDFAANVLSESQPNVQSHAVAVTQSPSTMRPIDRLHIPHPTVQELSSSTSTQPPTPNAQISPPTYEQTIPQMGVGGRRDSNRFPPEFGGLLPSREITTSPPVEVPQVPPQPLSGSMSREAGSSGFMSSLPHSPTGSLSKDAGSFGTISGPPQSLSGLLGRAASGVTSGPPHFLSESFSRETGSSGIFSGPYQPHQAQAAAPAQVQPTAINSGDDFDSAFDDLDEAKEADQSQDAFAIGSDEREDAQFNPIFESPAPSRTTTTDYQQTPGSTFGGVSTHSSAAFGSSTFSSSGFDGSAFGSTAPPVQTFGGLEPSSGASTSSPRTSQAPKPETFASFTPSFGGSPSTASPQPYQTSKLSQQVQQPEAASHDWDSIFSGLGSSSVVQSNGNPDPFALDKPGPSSGQRPPITSQQRPPAGRALSSGTEHDDPILKSLTGMGYNRDDALKALERYDYNIDKAADYLTSKH